MDRNAPRNGREYSAVIDVTRESLRRIEELAGMEHGFWSDPSMGNRLGHHFSTRMFLASVRPDIAEELAGAIVHSNADLAKIFEEISDLVSRANRTIGSLDHQVQRMALRKRQAASERSPVL